MTFFNAQMESFSGLFPSLPNSIIMYLLSIVLFVWCYMNHKSNYWAQIGVPFVSSAKCFYQTLAFALGRKCFFQLHLEQYLDLEGHKHGGSFQLLRPALVLRDPEAVKEWLVKGFPNFHDRDPISAEKSDKLAGNLFQLTGEKWKAVHKKLSPAFSPVKLKIMYPTLRGCAQELDAYLRRLCEETGQVEIDVKDLISNYTFEAIGACALGIRCNAIQDPNCELKRTVKKIFRVNWRRALFALLEPLHPKLPELIGLKAAGPEVEKYLRGVVREAMELRAKEISTTRADFLQILMDLESEEANEQGVEVSQDKGIVFTEDVIVGIIGSFLAMGTEPLASMVSLCLYELARNPEIQDKVFKELQTVTNGTDGNLSFEDLNKLKYAEQVIDETARKYPVTVVLRRICTEAFKIPGTSNVVQKNVKLFISTHGLQNDPKYFPEPEKFDPERFSEENIHKIVSGSYLPFGIGHRYCIAKRLVVMNVKTAMLTIVSNYTLHTCAKTEDCLEFDPSYFALVPKSGVWLRLKRRDLHNHA